MTGEGKHVCMLAVEPIALAVSPHASWWERLLASVRATLLPCEWHRAAMLFVRSHRKLEMEQARQILSGYWYIWHPYSPLKFYWECNKLIIFCIAFFYMPLLVFISCPNMYDKFVLFSDLTAFCEMVVNFLTGRLSEDGKSVILHPRVIAAGYLRSDFAVDLIGALPLQLIQITDGSYPCEHPTRTSWLVLKLFRLRAINRAWTCLLQQYELTYIRSRSISLAFIILVFFHWLTYLNFQVPTFYAHLYPNEFQFLKWYQRFKVQPVDETTPLEKYVTNLYHVCGLCIGSSGVTLDVLPEMVTTSFIGIFGLLFITYAFTAIIRLIFYHQWESIIYTGRLKELQEYLQIHGRLPVTLRHKVQLYVDYKYNGHLFDEDAIMETINEQIKQEINMFACKKLVVNVPLFKDMPIALINTIIFSLTKVLYMPGEVVIRCGKPGSSLYLIASGTVTVLNANAKEIAHLTDGAYFGERALLYPGTPRQATVVALEITEIYKLSHRQLALCLQANPRLRRRLEDAVREHAHAPLKVQPPPRRRRTHQP